MSSWQIILFLLAALLARHSHAALVNDLLGANPIVPTALIDVGNPSAITTSEQPTSASITSSTLTTTTKPSKTPATTVFHDDQWWKAENPKDRQAEREMVTKKSQDVMIGGLMILVVGLLGPLMLYCWIRKRRREEEAEFAAYVAANPQYPPPGAPGAPPSPQTSNLRRQEVEMRNIPVNRPASPSGVPPPPTYQEALATGRIPEQPK